MCRAKGEHGGGRRCHGPSASREAARLRQRQHRARQAGASPAAVEPRRHVPSFVALLEQQPTDIQRLGGQTAYTDQLTYADGTRVIRKTHGERAASIGDVVEMADAEELAARVLEAVGLRTAAVHRTAPNEVYLEYVDGEDGADLFGPPPDAVVHSADGRLLGIADTLIMNGDRGENWRHTPDGRTVGYDHGSAFQDWPRPDGAFARAVEQQPPTAAEAAAVRGPLEALRPAFQRRGREAWWSAMMRRLDGMADVTSP